MRKSITGKKFFAKGSFLPVFHPIVFLLGILLLAAVSAAGPQRAFAAQEITLKLPTGSDGYVSGQKSDPFLLIMEEADMSAGYHHPYTGSETSREVYVKMNMSYTSEIWLSISLPMITRGSAFSAVSYDLLKEDRKTVICSARRALASYRQTELYLFRGMLPAGSYYLRFHHYYDGDCDQATNTNLTIQNFTAYPSLTEDDLKGANNSMQTAAPMGDRQTGYISMQGNDPADWYSFTVGAGGAALKAERIGEGWLSAAVYRQNGEAVIGKKALYDALTADPLEVELEEGSYYAAIFFDEVTGETVLNRRGGAYNLWLTSNSTQMGSGTCGNGLTWEFLKSRSGSSFEYTLKISGTGAMKDYTTSSQAPWYSLRTNSPLHVVIGSGVTSVGNYAFTNTGLKDITLPASVKTIGDYAFNNCASLESIQIPAAVTSIGKCAFFGCSRLASAALTSSLKTIGTQAFDGCRSLKKVTIPGSLAEISYGAFQHCEALEEVTVSSGVKNIAEYAFGSCKALKDVTLPGTISSLQSFSFEKCTALEKITIPSSISSTMMFVFKDCTNLKDVYYGGSKSMWENVYWSGSNDLTQAAIHYAMKDGSTGTGTDSGQTGTQTQPGSGPAAPAPDGTVVSVNAASYEVTGGGAAVIFRKYTGAEATVTVPSAVVVNGTTFKVTSIASGAFKKNKTLKTVKIGSNVTSIGSSAFAGCTSLKKVSGGKNVKSIGSSAFQGCSKLTSMAMGSRLTTIGAKAFYKCTALAKITVPAKVSKIGKSAFQGCKKLKTITIKTTKLTTKKVGAKAFTGTASNAVVKVPKASLKAYKKWLTKKGISKKASVKS